MRISYLIITSVLFLLPSMVWAVQPTIITSDSYYIINDDNPKYAQPLADEKLWQQHQFNGIELSQGISWIQINFELPNKQALNKHYGVLISLLGSFEVYWDGQFIGNNGVVGNSKSTEQPGLIDKTLLIPSILAAPGKHTLSLRISSQYTSPDLTTGSFFSLISDYQYLVQLPYKKASRPLLMSGALLLVALYSLVIYFTSFRQPSYIIFSALCLFILLLMLVESWRGLLPYTYDWQIPRLQIVLVLSCLTSVLFTAFFAWFFKFSRQSRMVWLLAVVFVQIGTLISVIGYDNRSLLVFVIGITAAGGLCIQGLLTKQQYAPLMLGGLLLFTAPILINTYSYMDQYFFLSFSALLCLMLYTLAQNMNQRHKELIQSQITSSRLELELVKRNLQPHFILNTLTAVEEWIEESPATAVKFINALADEFRFMAATSAQSIITLHEELELCQSHLKVMAYRTNMHYLMNIDANRQSAAIPPGILLTLIENAISHNNYRAGTIEFSLVQVVDNNRQTLQFSAPVSNKKRVEPSSGNRIHLGIGSQYIEARLTESFGQHWQIDSILDDGLWRVTLTLPLNVSVSSNMVTQ